MAERPPALLPEQGGGQQVAAAFAAQDAAPGGGRGRAPDLRGADFLRIRSRRNSGRGGPRSARTGGPVGYQAIRDVRGAERFTDLYWGAGGTGSSCNRRSATQPKQQRAPGSG